MSKVLISFCNITNDNNNFKLYDSEEEAKRNKFEHIITFRWTWKRKSQIDTGREFNYELGPIVNKKLKIVKYNNVTVRKHSSKLREEEIKFNLDAEDSNAD